MFKESTDRGRTAEYLLGGFGGRVHVHTTVTEEADEHLLLVREEVTEGDLENGGWTWRARSVPGGTDVELTWNLDPVPGSRVLSTFASSDPVAHESLVLYWALSFFGDVVGGRLLPRSRVVRP